MCLNVRKAHSDLSGKPKFVQFDEYKQNIVLIPFKVSVKLYMASYESISLINSEDIYMLCHTSFRDFGFNSLTSCYLAIHMFVMQNIVQIHRPKTKFLAEKYRTKFLSSLT